MKKLCVYCFCALLALASVGCAGRQYHRAGDSAYARGDMRAALYNYQRAVDHDGDLYAEPQFASKLAHAESRVAYTDAVRLERGQRYDAAIDKLQLALDRDPDYDQARALLKQTRRLSGEQRLSRAVELADQGDLAMAELELNKARVHDPDNPDIALAKRSLTPDQLTGDTPGVAAWWSAYDAANQRDWPAALDGAEQAIRQNPYILPARELRFVASASLAESRALTEEAQKLYDSKLIGSSLEQVATALDIWPGNDAAKLLQQQSQASRKLAQESYLEANKLAGEQQWDAAIAKAASAVEIDRSLGELNRLRADLPTRAADDATRIGLEDLNQGEIAKAETAFRRALSYREDHAPALRGMAQSYQAWGKALEADGRPGAALLHYRVGKGYAKIGPVSEGYTRNYAAIREGLGIGLTFEVQGRNDADISGRSVGNALAGSLEHARQAGLAIGGNRSHRLVTQIKTADIDSRLVNSENRTHQYIVQEWVYNDAYDHIQHEQRREQAHLEKLCRRYARQTGHSHHQHDPHHDANVAHLYNEICRSERIVADLHRELRRTPREIQVDVKKYWDFVVESHEMTGSLITETQVIDNATGNTIDTFETRTGMSAEDQTIINENPAIGLHGDPLELPDPRRVANDLAGQVADSISDRAVNLIVQQRLDVLRQQSEALREAGKAEQALEVDVQAAVLLGVIDAKSSGQMLDRLGRERTR